MNPFSEPFEAFIGPRFPFLWFQEQSRRDPAKEGPDVDVDGVPSGFSTSPMGNGGPSVDDLSNDVLYLPIENSDVT